MKRTPEWYETYQKRMDSIKRAREWNGHKDTSDLGNVEFVTVTGGGVESRHADLYGNRPAAGESDSRVSAPNICRGTVGSKPGQAKSSPAAGVASGPPTPLYPLVTLCRSMRIAEPVPEYRFHPQRKWRADYCWPTHMLMLEVNGGVWTQGRHTRGQGAIEDMAKLSEAAILGYRVLYCTPEQLHNGVALDRIIRALTDRKVA